MADGDGMTLFGRILAALRDTGWLTRERVRGYAVIVLALEALALLFWAGRTYDLYLPIDPPSSLDFMSFYAAGTLADRGTPALAYDIKVHKATEKQIYGDQRIPYYGFFYPPVFLMFCAALAALPFTLAYLVFVFATGAAFWFVLRRTIGDPVLTLALLSFPAAFLTIALGQNAFLTAALFGGALLALDRRPILAGILFGAMCYKPHFLVLVPVALIAGRYWKTLAASAATVVALSLLSALVLGWQSWVAFYHIALVARSAFEAGGVAFSQLVSIFGAVRLAGGGTGLALVVQFIASLAAAVVTAVIWYRRPAPEIRAIVLVAATLVAVPVYLFYDLLPVTIALAWLMRDARAKRYFPWEKTVICLLWPVALLCRDFGRQTHIPIGWTVAATLLALALHRALSAEQIREIG